MKKNILVIMNNSNINNFEYINPNFIFSSDLSNYSITELTNIISKYQIIIISGGPQHLTLDQIDLYPEINNLIICVQLCKKLNKVLIGICLGCQIIAYTFDLEICSINKYFPLENIIGINYLQLPIITNDNFISKLDSNLLVQAFSYHYDFIKINSESETNTEIEIIANSINNIPYIIKHKTHNIYGFQMHPEINISNINKCEYLINNYSEEIAKNFFDTILNCFYK
jgi:anthranilate/para-aminobenzoate synthase component II